MSTTPVPLDLDPPPNTILPALLSGLTLAISATWSLLSALARLIASLVRLVVGPLYSLVLAPVGRAGAGVVGIGWAGIKVMLGPVMWPVWGLVRGVEVGWTVVVALEPLYIFFGCALLIGAIAGLCLHVTFTAIFALLDVFNHEREAKQRAEEAQRLREQQYRAQQQRLLQQQQHERQRLLQQQHQEQQHLLQQQQQQQQQEQQQSASHHRRKQHSRKSQRHTADGAADERAMPPAPGFESLLHGRGFGLSAATSDVMGPPWMVKVSDPFMRRRRRRTHHRHRGLLGQVIMEEEGEEDD